MRRTDLLSGLAVFAIAWLVYANAMPAAAVHDDEFFVPSRYALDAASVRRMFTQDTWAAIGAQSGLYRPLTLLSIALDGALWGDDARGYHRTNVLLHALASVAVLAFLGTLLRKPSSDTSPWPALVGAAVFAVHPIHTEAVDSVFNRSEILATLFVVLGLIALARRSRRDRLVPWAIATASFAAALLCRESAIAFPLLAALMLALVPGDDHDREAPLRHRIAPLAVLLLPAAAYLLLRRAALADAGGEPSPLFGVAPPTELGGRLFYSLAQIAEYARMLVWPWPLRISYEDFTGQAFRSAVLLHGALLGTALFARRPAPLVSFAIGFFYAALLPATLLIATAGTSLLPGSLAQSSPTLPLLINERVAYLPSVSLSLLLALGCAAIMRAKNPSLALAPAAVLIVTGALVTRQRNLDWHDPVRLYEAEVAAAPQNGDGFRHLIPAYSAAGKLDEALRACDAQLGGDLRSPYFFINCGSVYFRIDRYDAAIHAYRRANELGLVSVAQANLGLVYLRLGRTAEAEAAFVAAAEAEPNPMRQHYRRGELLSRFHPERTAEAIEEYRKALQLQPTYAPARRALERLSN